MRRNMVQAIYMKQRTVCAIIDGKEATEGKSRTAEEGFIRRVSPRTRRVVKTITFWEGFTTFVVVELWR
jgi:hypothetical protein